jgi:hypothetical protein
MYEAIETHVMANGPICWNCNCTKFIGYIGTETAPTPEGKFGVCRGCGRLYKLDKPNLSLIKESDDPDVKKFFDTQEFVAEFVESVEGS